MNKSLQGIALILKDLTWEVAIGTGQTPAWVDNETLESEVDRADATVSLASLNIPDDTLIFDASFTLAAKATIAEIGVFKSGSDPFMLCRMLMTPIEFPAGYPIPIQMKVPLRRP